MAARCRHDAAKIPAVHKRRRKGEALRHRRTGAVHTEKGNGEIACRKACRNDLIEQIARDDEIDFIAREVRVGNRPVNDVREHLALRLFVGALAEHVVRKRRFDIPPDDPLALLCPRNCAHGDNARLSFKYDPLSHISGSLRIFGKDIQKGGLYRRPYRLKMVLLRGCAAGECSPRHSGSWARSARGGIAQAPRKRSSPHCPCSAF